MELKDKVIIITGASAGIGETTALCIAKFTPYLTLTGRNEAKLKEVAKKVEQITKAKPLIVPADLTKDIDVKRIVDETIDRFKRIDVLINNAGAGANKSLKDGIGPFDDMINTNLRSVYLLTHFSVPHLIKTKGNIVNVSSVAAIKPIADFMPYCVSKAGLDMFTKCAALELAKHGVKVNSVNPGPVVSEFHDRLGLGKVATDEMMKDRANRSPLGKIAKSEEVADVIVFLATAESVTGSIYVIDNGILLS